MTEVADLLISLFHQIDDQYIVELRYYKPESSTELIPIRGLADFNEDTLRSLKMTLQVPKEHGRRLREALFADPKLVDHFKEYRANAGGSLRLRIQIDPNVEKLGNLRWETLYDLDDVDFIAINANQPFSRFIYSSDYGDYELRPKGRLRALVVVANPLELARPKGYRLETGRLDERTGTPYARTLVPINVASEIKRTREALKDIHMQVLTDHPGSLGRATLKNIKTELRHRYDILYLVCHGALLVDDEDQSEQKETYFLLLEKEDGSAERVRGEVLVSYIRNLPAAARPRLIVLAACQSGGKGKVPPSEKEGDEADEEERSYDHGEQAILGPRLVDAGVPAVVAMQDNIKMETVKQFMQAFFEELLKDGRVDQAMATARSQIHDHRPDWWVPVLYLRLRRGRLWHDPGFYLEKGGQEFILWNTIIDSIENEECTPVLGPWLMEPLLGSPREIAQQWLKKLSEIPDIPGDPRQLARYLSTNQDDLSQIAQILTTQFASTSYPRNELIRCLVEFIKDNYYQDIPSDLRGSEELPDLLAALVEQLHRRDPENPYSILARLPFKIYINASQDNMLEKALEAAGRRPIVEYFRWNEIRPFQNLLIDLGSYRPSRNEPLVYHMFGRFNLPETLVLTEDDYFEYLMQVSKPSIIPNAVSSACTQNSLLFLGFNISDWNFRVLIRSILSEDVIKLRHQISRKYKSVAVQVPPTDGVIQPQQVNEYLNNYFDTFQFRIYWGSAEFFLKTLWEKWPQPQKTTDG